MITLTNCGVVFHAENHTYTYNGKDLRGITSTLVDWMFPSTYEGIPEEVLTRAAQHGSFVHSCIEMADVVGASDDCPESADYLRIMDENKMRCIAHEYIVSDRENFASAIDLVLQDEQGEVWLADIKTTSALHTDKVKLQLSIYAFLFEQLNPTIKVKGLVEVWLPKAQYGKATWQPIERVSSDDVKRTIVAYTLGEANTDYLPLYASAVTTATNTLPEVYNEAVQALAEFERQVKAIKTQEDEIKRKLLDAFKQHDVKKFESEQLVITYIAPTTRTSVDTSKLKAEYPDVYEACIKQTNVNETIKITLR